MISRIFFCVLDGERCFRGDVVPMMPSAFASYVLFGVGDRELVDEIVNDARVRRHAKLDLLAENFRQMVIRVFATQKIFEECVEFFSTGRVTGGANGPNDGVLHYGLNPRP